jgi:sensor histidine kinase YesM
VFLQSGIQSVLIPPFDDVQQKHLARSFLAWLETVRAGFADQIFIYIAIVLAGHAYEYLKRLRREERERYLYQQALVASEVHSLKAQLRPHFLFNTLYRIATLSNGWLLPRPNGLLVPQMILQPLIQNAIRYGVSCAREGGWVAVAANQKDGILEIQVRNSVGGKSSSGTGVGLRNAEARLKYLYSGDAHLRLTVSDDRTATVSPTLPALHAPPASTERPFGRTVH